jgi:hypothetical protein
MFTVVGHVVLVVQPDADGQPHFPLAQIYEMQHRMRKRLGCGNIEIRHRTRKMWRW